MNITERLRQFDGRHVKPLEDLATQLLHVEGSVDELLALSNIADARTQTAATWILKRLQELGIILTAAQTLSVFRLLRNVSGWEARLHLLQMLDSLEIPSRNSAQLLKLLAEFLDDENKLIRAWSYNGLFVVGEQHQKHRRAIAVSLQAAQSDDAASVRARIRRICRSSDWTGNHEQSG